MKKLLLLLIPLLFISCDFNKENNETQQPSTTQPTTQQPATTQPTTQQPATDQPTTPPAEQPTTPVTDPETPSTDPETPPEEPIVSSNVVYTINISDIPSTNGYFMNSKENFYFCGYSYFSYTQCSIGKSGDTHFIKLRNTSEISIADIPPSGKRKKITMTVGTKNNKNSVCIKPYALYGEYETCLEPIYVSASENPCVLEFVFPAFPTYTKYCFKLENDDNKSILSIYNEITIQDYVE